MDVLRSVLTVGLGLIALLIISVGAVLARQGDIPPKVIDSVPYPGEFLLLDGPVTLTFNQAMDQASVESAFALDPAVEGAFEWIDGRTVRFTPGEGWARDAAYTLTVGTGAQSEDGAAMADPYTLELHTVGYLSVTAAIPAEDADFVNADSTITVTFDSPVVPLVSTAQLGDLPDPLSFDPAIEGAGEWLNTSIYQFKPAEPLKGGTTYTATVAEGLEAVNGALLPESYVWRFSTLPPEILSVSPSQNESGVMLERTARITFSQPMDRASVEDNFSLLFDGDPVAGAFEWDDTSTTVTYKPDEMLNIGSFYMLSLGADAKSAEGDATLRQGVSYVFTTVPLPGIEETWPKNGETGVRPGSGVTIEFRSPMNTETFKDKVEISPEPPEWSPVVYGPGRLYVQFASQPETRYTITFKRGAEDVYGNAIETDYTFSYATGPIDSRAWLAARERFAITGAYREDTRLPMIVSGTPSASFELYELQPEHLPALMRGYGRDKLDKLFGKVSLVRKWSETFDSGGKYNQSRPLYLQQGGGALPKGAYWLRIHYPNSNYPSDYGIGVTNATVTLKRSPEGVFAWVTGMESGDPLAGITVTVYTEAGQPAASGETDDQGVVQLAYRDNNSFSFAIAEGEGVYGLWSAYSPGTPPDFTAAVYTDRPIYRTDQTVYFRGVLRDKDDVAYTPMNQDKVRVVASIGWGEQQLYEGMLDVTAFGTFSGQFDIPADSRLGEGQIEIYSAIDRLATIQFTVAEFRVPEFTVGVSADVDSIRQGRPFNALTEADFYSGGAVSNAQLTWRAYGQPAYFSYSGPGRYSFRDETLERWWQYDMGSGEGTTDANGNFLLTLENTTPPSPIPMTITVESTVTDESYQAISGRTSIMAHPANIYIGLRSEKYFGKVGEAMPIHIIAVDAESHPIAGKRVDFEIVETRWTRVEVEGQFGRYTWEQEEIPVLADSIETGEDGKAVYEFMPEDGGIFRFRAEALDEYEKVNSSSIRFRVVGNRPIWWGEPSETLELIANQDSYKVGDTVEILVPLPFQAESTVLVSAERVGVLDYEVMKVEGSTLLYSFPVTEVQVPTVHFSVVAVKGIDGESLNPEYKTGSLSISVEPESKRLDVTVTPSVPQAQPRDEVSFDVKVVDHTGEPVVAEVGLRLTDKAILSLAPPNFGALEQTFYGYQRNYVNTGISLSALVDGLTDELVGEYEEQMKAMNHDMVLMDGAMEMGEADGMVQMRSMAMPTATAGAAPGGPGFEEVEVREDFQETPLWAPHVVTAQDGTATVTVTMPDNLTTWNMEARALTDDTLVGRAEIDFMSTLPLLVRPVAPRFMVEGDLVTLAMVINNNTAEDQTVDVLLEYEGVELEGSEAQQQTVVAANGRARVEWIARVQDVPYADFTFIAVGADGFQDASKPTLGTGPDGTIPVYHYTAPDTTGTGGLLLVEGSALEGIALPPRLVDASQGNLILKLDPSLAVTITDSFDYLINFKHQCIEQTVSRFLPNTLTYRALRDLGIEDEELRANLTGVMTEAVQKLRDAQNADGGWGWFSHMRSNPYVTAYAALALIEAQETGFGDHVEAPFGDMIPRALNYVKQNLITPNIDSHTWQLNRQAFFLYVLARGGETNTRALNALFEQRLEMMDFGRAYLIMAYDAIAPGSAPIDALVGDIVTNAILSATGAHWEDRYHDWYNWSSDTRTTAIILAALTRVDAGNALLPNVVRWLMVARQGDHWTTTQETVWSLIAFTDWMVSTGELEGSYEYNVRLNDDRLSQRQVTPETVREGEVLRVAVKDLVLDGLNRLLIARGAGEGALYYTAHLDLRLWASEVDAISRGITVNREYFLDDPEVAVTSATVGDTITVRVTVTASQDVHFFVLEDPIPAGTEPVDTALLTTSTEAQAPQLRPDRDPYYWYWGWWVFDHTEMRDEQVNLYADYLPRGTYVYTYQVRATVPGEFQTMPSHAYAFYFPEVFGRGDGMLFTVNPEE